MACKVGGICKYQFIQKGPRTRILRFDIPHSVVHALSSSDRMPHIHIPCLYLLILAKDPPLFIF